MNGRHAVVACAGAGGGARRDRGDRRRAGRPGGRRCARCAGRPRPAAGSRGSRGRVASPLRLSSPAHGAVAVRASRPADLAPRRPLRRAGRRGALPRGVPRGAQPRRARGRRGGAGGASRRPLPRRHRDRHVGGRGGRRRHGLQPHAGGARVAGHVRRGDRPHRRLPGRDAVRRPRRARRRLRQLGRRRSPATWPSTVPGASASPSGRRRTSCRARRWGCRRS